MINNIQALRAWASIIVVLYHAIGTAKSYGLESNYFALLGSWGMHGVDIFFVISGFIMFYTQNLKSNKPSKFLKDRIIRIVPIYWMLTTFYLLLYFFIPSIFRDFSPDFQYILSSYFFLSGIIFQLHPILSYGWTLEYEAIYYLVFAIILFFPRRIQFILVAVFLIFIYLLFSYLSVVIFEFIFGMLVAYLYLKKGVNKKSKVILILGIFILFSSIFVKVTESTRLFYYGASAFLIVYGLLGVKETNSKLLVVLGSASYSIYLIHVFTLPLFYKISSKIFYFIDGDILLFIAILFTVSIGTLFYYFVEKPVTKKLKARFD